MRHIARGDSALPRLLPRGRARPEVLPRLPIAQEDHAQRACYAALELRHALRAYADEVRRAHGISFSTRMGLNSGEVVVGKIGDDLRMDYTAQGHTVGLAQRMEGLAEPGSAFLTEHTARLVEGYFALDALGTFSVKGVQQLTGRTCGKSGRAVK